MTDDDTNAPSHRRNGETHKFQNRYIKEAHNYCQLGATDADLARFFDVNRSTIHAWRVSHPEFADACRVGKEAADERVKSSTYERACGYEHEATKVFLHEGKPVYATYQEHIPADGTLARFWLKNRCGWREQVDLEHTGKDGGPIVTKEASDIEAVRLIGRLLTRGAVVVPATQTVEPAEPAETPTDIDEETK